MIGTDGPVLAVPQRGEAVSASPLETTLPAAFPAMQRLAPGHSTASMSPGPPGAPSSRQRGTAANGSLEETILPLSATAMQKPALGQETAWRLRVGSSWVCTQDTAESGSLTLTILPPPSSFGVPEATATHRVGVGQETPFRWVSAPAPSRSVARQVAPPPAGFAEAYRSPA